MPDTATDWLRNRARVEQALMAGGEQNPVVHGDVTPTRTTDGRIPWSGLLVPYGVRTGDDRLVKVLTSRDTPLHLFWQPIGADEHDGKITVGTITETHSSSAGMYGSGYFLNPDAVTGHVADAVRNAIALMDEGLGQISGDIVKAVARMDGNTVVVESGELGGATLVGVPAFAESRIAVDAADTLTVTFSVSELHLGAPSDAVCVDCDQAATRLRHMDDSQAEWVCAGHATATFAVTGSGDLPLADPSRGWDGNRAKIRMLDAARSEGGTINAAQASRGFFWRDGDPSLAESYKLPFADLVNGRLTAVPSALSAVLSRLGATDGPSASQKESIRRKVESYQRRLDNGDGDGRGVDHDTPEESNMANNDGDCPEGQHRMPDGECMDDEDMSAAAGVHLEVGEGLVLTGSNTPDDPYRICLADAPPAGDTETTSDSGESSESAESVSPFAKLGRELAFADLEQEMNGSL